MKKTLDELAKEVRREYFREWRKKNPEKVRAMNQRYWQRRAQKMNESEVKQ